MVSSRKTGSEYLRSTTNDMNNQNSSKIQALRSVLAWNQLPAITGGKVLPVANFAAGSDGVSPWRYFDGGASMSYLFNVPLVYGGNYSLSLSVTNYNANSTMQVFLNNKVVI